jgi:hypothetical protein
MSIHLNHDEIEPLDEDDERILDELWSQRQKQRSINKSQQKAKDIEDKLRDASSRAQDIHKDLDDLQQNHAKFEPLD